MGMRFRKSIKLGKHVRINLSKSGLGCSVGTKGYRISKTANSRTRTTVSVPGTGISHVSERKDAGVSAPSISSSPPSRAPFLFSSALIAVLISVFCFFVCIFGGFLLDSDSTEYQSNCIPSISIVPMDDITMTVGESRTLTLSHGGFVPDPDSPAFSCTNSDLLGIKIISGTDFTFQISITANKEGSCRLFSEYGGIESNSISISILPADSPEINPEEEETLPIPQSVYTFIVNKSSKVIHRFGCSHAPENGTSTPLFYEWLEEGYRKCSYCFD